MFATPVNMDGESSRDVTAKSYLEKPAIRVLLVASRKRKRNWSPGVAIGPSANQGTLQNCTRIGILSHDYDGVCSVGCLDLDSILASVASGGRVLSRDTVSRICCAAISSKPALIEYAGSDLKMVNNWTEREGRQISQTANDNNNAKKKADE